MKCPSPLLSFALAAPVALGFSFAGIAAAQDDAQDDATAQDAAPAKAEKPKVTGQVIFDGDVPEQKELSVPAKAAAGCCPPGEKVNSEDLSLVISKEGAIQGVVVTVKVEGVEVEIPEKPYEIDQKSCRFLPHLLVVPKGAKVAFLNSDTTSHNVHLISMYSELNQTVLGGKSLERTFDKAERIKVTCDMHTWMKAWLVVTDATHWAVTDEKGAFSFEGLPAGEHEVTFWHETLGSKTTKVTVGEDGKAGPIAMKMAKKKSKKRRRRR